MNLSLAASSTRIHGDKVSPNSSLLSHIKAFVFTSHKRKEKKRKEKKRKEKKRKEKKRKKDCYLFDFHLGQVVLAKN